MWSILLPLPHEIHLCSENWIDFFLSGIKYIAKKFKFTLLFVIDLESLKLLQFIICTEEHTLLLMTI